MFTVYGQPITYPSPMNALGRWAIEANKPKVFEDAVKMIAASSGGPRAPAGGEDGAAKFATGTARRPTLRRDLPPIQKHLNGLAENAPPLEPPRLHRLR